LGLRASSTSPKLKRGNRLMGPIAMHGGRLQMVDDRNMIDVLTAIMRSKRAGPRSVEIAAGVIAAYDRLDQCWRRQWWWWSYSRHQSQCWLRANKNCHARGSCVAVWQEGMLIRTGALRGCDALGLNGRSSCDKGQGSDDDNSFRTFLFSLPGRSSVLVFLSRLEGPPSFA